MNRVKVALTALGALTVSTRLAVALEFPSTCITPPATVTSITGIDTRNARMEARYTLPDIIQACHAGYVDQEAGSTADCIKRHRRDIYGSPLHARADCVAGVVNVEGLETKLPAHADCASGGIRAMAAFKTLCPAYAGEIERPD